MLTLIETSYKCGKKQTYVNNIAHISMRVKLFGNLYG